MPGFLIYSDSFDLFALTAFIQITDICRVPH